uniref:Putative ovule protein n=1 Tax=Solanum chacoense TaxID=4108 RepID=A0A0V0HQA7_SOLCH
MTALNEALTAEVQRLKIATAELSADASKFQQLSLNPQMFQSQQQQSNQLNMHQLQQQQQSSQQQQHAQARQQLNSSTASKHESK